MKTPERISLASGAGGRAMRQLVQEVFLAGAAPSRAGDVGPTDMDDGAALRIGERWLVLTTDSYVVQPLFFPGGDIGRLAICGTVNDLAMMGATDVVGLTCGVIVAEGFARADLERIQRSMQIACAEAQVRVVTGDTKVLAHGELDGLVLNTAGVAWTDQVVRDCGLQAGDVLILSGSVGDHGMAIAALRSGLDFGSELRSDVAPLRGLIRVLLGACGADVSALKDPTRGGVASAVHEMATKSGVAVTLHRPSLPVRAAVRAAADLLGMDPLHLACEGKALIGVRPWAVERALAAIHGHPLGREAAVIGAVLAEPAGQVVLDTGLGRRLLREPEGEPLPRIC